MKKLIAMIFLFIVFILGAPLLLLSMCSSATTNPVISFNIPEGYLKDSYDLYIKDGTSFIDNFANIISVAEGDDLEKYNKSLIKKIKSDSTDEQNYLEYRKLFSKVINGLVGNYDYLTRTTSIVTTYETVKDKDGKEKTVKKETEVEEDTWEPTKGIKAYFPIPKGFKYTHADDYGDERGYGDISVHEGNDILADRGTPVVNIEAGTIERIGWNEYGGWRIGIRSLDKKRYLYYAHLSKYGQFLQEGQKVEPGQVIGYIGDSGYGPEGTTGKFPNHLHLQIEVDYTDEDSKTDSRLNIDPFHILKFLEGYKAEVEPLSDGYIQKHYTEIRVN